MQLQRHTESTLDRVIRFLGQDPELKREPVQGAEVSAATATPFLGHDPELKREPVQGAEVSATTATPFLGHDPGLKRLPVEGAEVRARVRAATATLTSSLSSLSMLPPSFPHMP